MVKQADCAAAPLFAYAGVCFLWRVQMRRLRNLLCLVMMASASAAAQTQAAPLKTNGDVWWKHAVIYEVYPRSFQDTNGDGLGDIKGIEQRLGYLKSLGIDAIWITPMYPSPQIDFGYDIANYEAIDPQYGTMGDLDTLLTTAKSMGIRVIMDIVLNHTSDQHPWFKESRSSLHNPKRDWYIWRDGKDGSYPNNWQSWFGHSAWTKDEATGQFYYHYFYTQQPDLNWRNPEVRKAMYDIMRFWLDKGVAGFRMDAVSRLFEDPGMHDDPYLPGYNAFGDRNIQHKYTDDLPEVHEVLRELRKLADSYPNQAVLISEADEPTIADLSKMYGAHGDEVQLPMDFQIADANELSAPKFRKLFEEVENNPAGGWPEYFFSNHDQPRQWDRYGDGRHNDQIAKLMAVLELTARGTPQMYYGEELGMRTTDPARIEDVHDPIGKLGWPKEKGRDGERTPMQWDATAHAGFTTSTKPWLPIPPTAKQYNVKTESKDPNSILNTYKALLNLRKTNAALRDGEQITINEDDPNFFAFVRKSGDEAVVVVLNMSGQERSIRLDAAKHGVTGLPLQYLYVSDCCKQDDPYVLRFKPYGALVARLVPLERLRMQQ
jgi:alpha-glucosidase